MTVADLSPWIIAWCVFALVCGGLIKGTLGVGTPLLTVPMLTLVLPAQVAVTIMAIPVVIANLWQAANTPNQRGVVGRFWPTALALLAGTYVGLSILSTINERALLLIVGTIVIAMTFIQASEHKLFLGDQHVAKAGIVFGLLSGLIGGISSMFGPMLILYLVSLKRLDKNEFVSAISFLYVCAVVPWTLGLIASGLMSKQLFFASAAATIPVLAGVAIGQKIRQRISDQYFQKLILGILVISGASLLWQGVMRSA